VLGALGVGLLLLASLWSSIPAARPGDRPEPSAARPEASRSAGVADTALDSEAGAPPAERRDLLPAERRYSRFDPPLRSGPDGLLLAVLDQDSAAPVTGASVRVLRRRAGPLAAHWLEAPEWPSDLIPVATGRSDSRGEAESRALPPQPLWIEADLEGRYGCLEVEPPLHGQRLELVLEPDLSVEVQTLWEADGQAAPGVWLGLYQRQPSGNLRLFAEARSDSTGLATFRHLQRHQLEGEASLGDWLIRLQGLVRERPEVRFDPSRPGQRLELLCPAVGSIEVRVADAAGASPELGGSVHLEGRDEASEVRLSLYEPLEDGRANFRQVEVGLELTGNLYRAALRLEAGAELSVEAPAYAGDARVVEWRLQGRLRPDRVRLLDPEGRPLGQRLVVFESLRGGVRTSTDPSGVLTRPVLDPVDAFLTQRLRVWDRQRWLTGQLEPMGKELGPDAPLRDLQLRASPLEFRFLALDPAGQPLEDLAVHGYWPGATYTTEADSAVLERLPKGSIDSLPFGAIHGALLATHAPLACSDATGRFSLGGEQAEDFEYLQLAHPLCQRRPIGPVPPGIDPIPLQLEPAGMLRGRLLLGPEERPWLNGLVLIDESSSAAIDRVGLDRAGRFEFVSIPPGSYRLEALWSLPGPPAVLVRGLEIEAGRVLSGGDLDGIDVSGTVRRLELWCSDEEGDPLPQIQVFWRPSGQTVWQQGRCDGAGLARLNLPDGPVDLLVHCPGKRAFFGPAGQGEQRVRLGASPELSLAWRETPRLLPHHRLTIELSAGEPGWPELDSDLRIDVSPEHADLQPYPGGSRLRFRLLVRRGVKSGLPEERFERRFEVPLDPNAAQQSIEIDWPAEFAHLLR
jgi:hypothetical protein